MKHIKEFNRYAHTYDSYNIIQNQVVQDLMHKIQTRPKKIVDLGCGSGAVYKAIRWQFDSFVAVDKSQAMLDLHPCTNVTKHALCIEEFRYEKFSDHFFISASALQWCRDLRPVFGALRHSEFALAIFTANTFRSLHSFAKTQSPIVQKDAVLSLANEFLDCD
ncbi:MAG: methyltransferase domain-containing protein, partial [Campylobacterota bacterium]